MRLFPTFSILNQSKIVSERHALTMASHHQTSPISALARWDQRSATTPSSDMSLNEQPPTFTRLEAPAAPVKSPKIKVELLAYSNNFGQFLQE